MITICTDPLESSKRPSRLANQLSGWVLYPLGDFVAQLILADVDFLRVGIVMLLGGLVYRLEIPAWFRRLDEFSLSATTLARRPGLGLFAKSVDETSDGASKLNWIGRTIGAMIYFNPLWIGRHQFFVSLATIGGAAELPALVQTSLLTGCVSFLTNLPFSLVANYVIQRHLPMRFRFFASALATMLFTIKYALELRFLQ